MSEGSAYCRNCGHLKESHDLDAHSRPGHHGAPPENPACHEMSFDDHPCICFEYTSWT
jgi:hypothetical protein